MNEPISVLVSPSGEIAEFDPVSAQLALQSGWAQPSVDQLEEIGKQKLADQEAAAKEAKYNSAGQLVKAGVEGVARGLSFGASDLLESAVLDNAKDIKERESRHPILSFASEAGGMVLPMLVGVGEAEAGGVAAAKGIKGIGVVEKAPAAWDAVKAVLGLTPAGLANTAERSVARLIEKELPQTSSLVGKVMEKAVAEGAGQSITGAAMGLGSVMHENAIGDPLYTAEALVANPGRVTDAVGETALFTGVLGALIGGTGKLLGAGVEKITSKNFIEKMKPMLEELEARANVKAGGGVSSTYNAMEKAMGKDAAKQLLLDARDMGLIDTINSPTKTLEKIDKLRASAGEAVDEVISKTDQRILREAGMEVMPDEEISALKNVDDMVEKIRELSSEYLGSISEHQQGIGKRLSRLADELSSKDPRYIEQGKVVMPDPRKYPGGMSVKDLWKVSNELDVDIRGLNGLRGPEATQATSALERIRTMVNFEMKSRMTPAEVKQFEKSLHELEAAKWFEVFAKRGDAKEIGQAKRTLTELIGGGGVMEAMLAGGHGLMSAGIAGAAGAAAIAMGKHQGAGIVGQAARFLRDTIEGKSKILGGLANNNEVVRQGIAKDVRNILMHPVEVGNRITRTAIQDAERHDLNAESMAELTKQLRLASNPNVLQQRMNQLTENWYHHAPKTSTATVIVATKALNFLRSKVPPTPPPTPEELMSGEFKWRPSSSQVDKFNRYYNAVLNPRSILVRAKVGRLTAEEVEAVRTVYPKLFAHIQSEAIIAFQQAKGDMPDRVRNSFKLLTGGSFNIGTAMMVQATYAKKSMQANQPPPPEQAPRGEKIHEAARMALHPEHEQQ